MEQALTALSICVIDWVVASRAMAYQYQTVIVLDNDGNYLRTEPYKHSRHRFYDKKALGTDFFHIMGWPRYLALTWFAYLGFGHPLESIGYNIGGWEILAGSLYVATAITCSVGWFILKVLHGKLPQWGIKPGWMR